ncbi:MAG: flippase [Acidobacteriaceae bacterium]|nr:flippase [Acidobacteriaceae bacterium]
MRPLRRWLVPANRLARHHLVKNTAALLLVQISGYVAPLIVLPYLSRILTTEHFGLIAFATSFNWYFITLVEYGFNLTATRRIAIHCDNPKEVSRIFSSVMAAKAFLTVAGLAIMVTIVMATPKLRPHFLLFCLSYLAVIGDLLFPLWFFQGLQKMQTLLWRDLCAKFLSLALIFAFVHRDDQYLWAAGFQAGSTVVAGVLGLCTIPFVAPIRFIMPTFRDALLALREGWAVFLSMAAMTLSSSTNIFILGLRSGPVDVAYYIAAYRLTVVIRMLVSPVVTALYPHISHMAVNSRENAIAFLRKYAVVLASPFLAISLVLLAGASPIIKILYGAKYVPAIPLLRILAFSPFLLAFQHAYSTFYMLAFGYEKEWSRIIFLTAVLNFFLLIPLIYTIWPPSAVAITGILLDGFVATATYMFYRKNTSSIPQPVPA